MSIYFWDRLLLVNLFEEIFSKDADPSVNVPEGSLMTFYRRPKYCAIIMNCPEDMLLIE
jgi:hypothetical protein